MCFFIQHTLKEELKTIQIKSRRILQKQEKKLKNMGKTLEQIPVRRTCDQSVFVLYVLLNEDI